jgi:hypothetical protein
VTSAAKTFPSDFYVTAATVIPVLFLAVAVQGPAYENMITTAIRMTRPYVTAKVTLRSFARAVAGAAIIALAVILIMTVQGEIVALSALMTESATRADQNNVYTSVLTLLIAVIVPPVGIMIRAVAELVKHAWRSDREEQPSTPDRLANEGAGSQGDGAKDDPADAVQQDQPLSAPDADRRPAARPDGAVKARGRALVAGLRRRAAPPP